MRICLKRFSYVPKSPPQKALDQYHLIQRWYRIDSVVGSSLQNYRQKPREKIRRILVAVICGGRLLVMMPLNKMLTISPTQKHPVQFVCTTTSWPFARFLTSRLSSLTSRTVAIIIICVSPPVEKYRTESSYAPFFRPASVGHRFPRQFFPSFCFSCVWSPTFIIAG